MRGKLWKRNAPTSRRYASDGFALDQVILSPRFIPLAAPSTPSLPARAVPRNRSPFSSVDSS